MSAGGGVNEDELKLSLIGICRDLRGVVSVFNFRTAYLMLFEWMYPSNHCHGFTLCIPCGGVLKGDVLGCSVDTCGTVVATFLVPIAQCDYSCDKVER